MNISRNNTDSFAGSSIQDHFYPLSYVIALVLLSVLIILVNSLVVALFVTSESLRTRTNRILVSLALIDIINGLITIPLRISCNVEHRPALPQQLLTMVMYRFVAASTMFHILLVTLEKHICILYPLRYNSLITNARITLALTVVWLFSMFYAVIGLSWLGLPDESHQLGQPQSLQTSKALRFELAFVVFGSLFCFGLPLVIMCYSFTAILREISRHNKRESMHDTSAAGGKRAKLDRKPVIIFLTMALLFVLNWSSWYIELFVTIALMPKHYEFIGGPITEYFRFTGSLIHPMLYSLVKKDFRHAVRKLLSIIRKRVIDKKTRTTRQDSLLTSQTKTAQL